MVNVKVDDPVRDVKQKKVVTWADEVTPKDDEERDNLKPPALLPSLAGVSHDKISNPGTSSSASLEANSETSDSKAPVAQVMDSAETTIWSNSQASSPSAILDHDKPKDLILDAVANHVDSEPAQEASTDGNDVSGRFTGWDSDLSELSSSSEQSDDDGISTSDSSDTETVRFSGP